VFVQARIALGGRHRLRAGADGRAGHSYDSVM